MRGQDIVGQDMRWRGYCRSGHEGAGYCSSGHEVAGIL
jgi:hypothetical protein